MGEPALKNIQNVSTNESSTLEKFENTLTEELIIGVCSPIGSLKENVLDKLKHRLETEYSYKVDIIKLSDFIENHSLQLDQDSLGEKKNSNSIYTRYCSKIDKGNAIREKYGNGRLAEEAIQKINIDRVDDAQTEGKSEPTPEDFKSRRVCYIIDSIKTKEELLLFRKIYSENFYLISIFSSLEERKNNLKGKGFEEKDIVDIIEKDDKQDNKNGQNVRDVFVEGDLFMRVSKGNISKLEAKISRFLHLIFETAIITPTIEETAMYNAKAAAGNSACLSRQVGACIIDENNNFLSIGWNDVPKYGGNLYTTDDDTEDHRCFNQGYCSNDKHKSELVDTIVELLSSEIDVNKEDLKSKIKKNTKVKDLIEFSRSVHAEMHAIIQGALTTGDKLLGSRLFCTTYPCHNCARHIVATGIKEIYYIEPYVKSLCLTLHEDAMTEREDSVNKVKILTFDGISPNKYLLFFTKFTERKNKNGQVDRKIMKTAKPKNCKSLQALYTLEAQAVHSIKEKSEV